MKLSVKNILGISLVLLIATTVHADLQLFDDFETGAKDDSPTSGVLGGFRDCESNNTGNVNLETGALDNPTQSYRIEGNSSGDERGFTVTGVNNPIDEGETGVLFFRFVHRADGRRGYDWVGITNLDMTSEGDNALNSDNENDADAYIVAGFLCVRNSTAGTDPISVVRLHDVEGTDTTIDEELTTLTPDVWYDVWIEANNAADTFNLYIQESTDLGGPPSAQPTSNPILVNEPFNIHGTDALRGLAHEAPDDPPRPWADRNIRLYFDDIWWDGDQGLSAPVNAHNPNPANKKSGVPNDMILSWTPSEFASKHDVYFGKVFDNVNNADISNPLDVLIEIGQDANTYEPDGLDFEQTYYWRVDEVNDLEPDSPRKGNVWSFTVEPFAYPVSGAILATASGQASINEGPENTVNDSGLNNDLHSIDTEDMWLSASGDPCSAWVKYEFEQLLKLDHVLIWNYNGPSLLTGLGLKEVEVEYSVDDETWTQLENVGDFNIAPGMDDYASDIMVDLNGVTTKYIKITAVSNHGGGGLFNQYGLSEVRFYYIPLLAREPKPADGETDVALNPTLNWRAGREATSHQVYFGSDAEAVINESVTANSVSDSSLSVDPLNFGTTYYWKVNEINDTEDPNLWEADIWSFITKEYIVIDDFESYTDNDDAGEAIWQSWIDGYDDPTNGSTAGDPEPDFLAGEHYAETTIVHGGRQSMSLFYDNTGTAINSEVVYTFVSTQNWTVSGSDTLLVYYQGIPVRFAELAPDHIIMSGAGADIFDTADEFRFVYKQLTGDGTLLARVESLDNTHAWAKAGVMIRGTLDARSAWAGVFYAGENGARYQARLTIAAEATSDTPVATADQIAQRVPVWIKIERLGDQFNGYYSQDGENWTAMVWNPQTISMANSVYIGLAVTSHVSGTLCGAEFSAIESIGNVTGQWQVADVGVEQASGNSLDILYVGVEDSSGHKKTVNADSGAVAAGDWTPWPILISEFTAGGVDMTRIKKMYFGVGDRDNPMHGAGTVYIDDVQYGHAVQE